MSSETSFLGIPVEFVAQGAIGILVFFWAWKEARRTYRDTTHVLKPDPIVAGVSMAWDRDMQERFLQLLERLALAAEAQAAMQKAMSGSWAAMSDRQREDMNVKIERLLEALEDVESRRELSAMVARFTKS